MLLSVALPASALAAETATARTRVVVLPLQSYALTAEEVDAVSRALVDRFRADDGIELVDALPLLGEKAAGDWLKADKLLYDGIQDYQDLEFVKAVEQLRESAELMEKTFREFADTQGRRRMRDAYLHLGLSRLEQGEQKEADDWFAKAARVDPGFQPDPRVFPPAVRSKFLTVKGDNADTAFDASRDRMRDLAKLVGVDMVVAGGVRQETDTARTAWVVEIAWVDRWTGRSGVEAIPSAQKETVARSLRDATPKLLASVLQRPWPPAGQGPRNRRRFTVGAAGAFIPGARIRKDAGGGQVYKWDDDIRQNGVHVGLSPWERGAWAVETDVSLYFPQKMAHGGWDTPFEATGRFEGGGSLGAHVLRSFRSGRWALTPGVGLSLNESIVSFRSPQTQTGVVFLWAAPVASVAAQRTLVTRGGLETFVQLELAASYDVGGTGPAPLMLQSVASGGVSF